MITWLIGENDFEAREALKKFKASFVGDPEIIDGSEVTINQLPSIFMGMSLFAEQRLIIISDLSNNLLVWEKIPDWLSKLSDTTQLVLVDKKPDKRTKSYKALKNIADIQEFSLWNERDIAKAEAWVMHHSESMKIALTRKQAKLLVERAGVNQWQLVQALSILALLDEITDEAIITYTPGDASENVFLLFETALRGDAKEVRRMITALKYQQEPHMLLGLLSSQALSLAAVITASGTDDNPEKDFAIHPFVAKKMRYYTKKINQKDLAAIIEVFALADSSLKRSKAEPWLLIERALFKVAKIVNS